MILECEVDYYRKKMENVENEHFFSKNHKNCVKANIFEVWCF